MKPLWRISARLAYMDWFHELSLSVCGVLALASMLAPLLILHGVHNGVVEKLRESLMADPAVLVLIPYAGKGAGFEEDFLRQMRQAPGLRFGIGRARDVASELQLRAKDGRNFVITLEATAHGDPLLEDYMQPQPVSSPGNLQMVLSHTAAAKMDVQKGGTVTASIARRLANGRFTRWPLEFEVTGVLPAMAGSRDTAFVDLATLNAIQDFRDGIHAPLLQARGEMEPPPSRHYESFRAYAASLDDVPPLEKWFQEQGITGKTRARDIEAIKKIDTALASVIGLIAVAGCVGFFAFMASTARAAARRKWKQMGMLKLIGMGRGAIIVYPIMQSLLTAALGCLLAFAVYGGVAFAIDYLFASETGGEAICKISPSFFCLSFFCVLLLATLSSLRSALKAAAISPSMVIRES